MKALLNELVNKDNIEIKNKSTPKAVYHEKKFGLNYQPFKRLNNDNMWKNSNKYLTAIKVFS